VNTRSIVVVLNNVEGVNDNCIVALINKSVGIEGGHGGGSHMQPQPEGQQGHE